ncbi:MAG: hypothetical protein HN904_11915 [Victivallales bacterium]|jgi:hypothetical protein|nr:hypothetical protein [Victivallales bacterium]
MTKVQPTLVPASGSLDILFASDGKGEKEEVLVWWGLSLVERLRRDASSLETELSAGHHHNMGCRPATLVAHRFSARNN